MEDKYQSGLFWYRMAGSQLFPIWKCASGTDWLVSEDMETAVEFAFVSFRYLGVSLCGIIRLGSRDGRATLLERTQEVVLECIYWWLVISLVSMACFLSPAQSVRSEWERACFYAVDVS